MSKTKVVACAIVKDEPKFGETLDSLRACLGDALAGVVVHDTGPAPSRLAFTLASPIYFAHRPFDDFSSARNACIDDTQKIALRHAAKWVLMFSAGAEFSGTWAPPKGCKGTGEVLVHTERLGDLEFLKPGPISARSKLRYAGRTHESLDTGRNPQDLPHCGLIVDYTKDYSPEKKRARCLLDIELLATDFSPRGRYYLAQSFDVIGAYNEAFCYYAIRMQMTGYEPERLQAVCNAIRTAPTLPLARWALANGADCADAQLAMAERELVHQNKPEAQRAAVLASVLEIRSMFQSRTFAARCAEITEMCK